jgi:hypothetical protein
MVWIGFIWLKIGTSAGLCEHSKQTAGSIYSWELLDILRVLETSQEKLLPVELVKRPVLLSAQATLLSLENPRIDQSLMNIC